jgi:hypothetical protein
MRSYGKFKVGLAHIHRMNWAERHLNVAIPSWNRFAHHAATPATLFTVSDEAALSKLGYLRFSD